MTRTKILSKIPFLCHNYGQAMSKWLLGDVKLAKMASRWCQPQYYEEPMSWDPRVSACMNRALKSQNNWKQASNNRNKGISQEKAEMTTSGFWNNNCLISAISNSPHIINILIHKSNVLTYVFKYYLLTEFFCSPCHLGILAFCGFPKQTSTESFS